MIWYPVLSHLLKFIIHFICENLSSLTAPPAHRPLKMQVQLGHLLLSVGIGYLMQLFILSVLLPGAKSSSAIIPAGFKALDHVGTQWAFMKGTKFVGERTKTTGVVVFVSNSASNAWDIFTSCRDPDDQGRRWTSTDCENAIINAATCLAASVGTKTTGFWDVERRDIESRRSSRHAEHYSEEHMHDTNVWVTKGRDDA